VVQAEDEALISSVQNGLESGVYEQGYLTARERSVAYFQNWVAADLGNARPGYVPTSGESVHLKLARLCKSPQNHTFARIAHRRA